MIPIAIESLHVSDFVKELKEELQSNQTLWRLQNEAYPLKPRQPLQNPAAIQLDSIITEWGSAIDLKESFHPPVWLVCVYHQITLRSRLPLQSSILLSNKLEAAVRVQEEKLLPCEHPVIPSVERLVKRLKPSHIMHLFYSMCLRKNIVVCSRQWSLLIPMCILLSKMATVLGMNVKLVKSDHG